MSLRLALAASRQIDDRSSPAGDDAPHAHAHGLHQQQQQNHNHTKARRPASSRASKNAFLQADEDDELDDDMVSDDDSLGAEVRPNGAGHGAGAGGRGRSVHFAEPARAGGAVTKTVFDGETVPAFPDLDGYYANTLASEDRRGEPVYCLCRRGDMGRWMIGCDGCEEWYHGSCVSVSKRDEKLVAKYYCPRCDRDGVGKTSWRRKCRLQGCRKPRTGKSKYCVREHGLAYIKARADDCLVPKGQLVQLVRRCDGLADFQRKGDSRPDVDFKWSDVESAKMQALEEELRAAQRRLGELDRYAAFLEDCRARAVSRNAELKARKEKEICGYDYRLDDDNEATGIDTASEKGTCDTALRKCAKHGGSVSAWHAIAAAHLQLERDLLTERQGKRSREQSAMVVDSLRRMRP